MGAYNYNIRPQDKLLCASTLVVNNQTKLTPLSSKISCLRTFGEIIIYLITAGRIDYGERRLQLLQRQQDSHHINESPSFKMIKSFEAGEATTPSLTYKITNDTTKEIFIAELRRETSGQYKLKVMYDEQRSPNSIVSPAEALATGTPFAGVLTAVTPSVEFTVENEEIEGSKLSHAAIVESLEKGSSSDVDYTGLNLSNQDFSSIKFENLNLTGIDFTKANLQNSEFINCTLNGVTFRGATMGNTRILNCNNIRDADFSDAQLPDAFLDNSQFDTTNMMRVNLSHTVIRHCGFNNANMAGSNLQNTTLSNTKLIKTNLTQATLTSAYCCKVEMDSVILNNAKMRGIGMFDTYVDNSDLSFADLSCDPYQPEALDTIALKNGMVAAVQATAALKTECYGTTFSNTDLSSADFKNANLSYSHYTNKTRFIGTILSNVDLSHSSFSDVDLSHNRLNNLNLTGAIFDKVKLNGASFSGSTLTNADMDNLNMDGVCFNNATLTNARLINSSLIDSSFRHANLSNAEMSNAQLVSANMFDADLRFTNLSGANMDDAILIDARMEGIKLSKTTSMRKAIDTCPPGVDKYQVMLAHQDAVDKRARERSNDESHQSVIDYTNYLDETTASINYENYFDETTAFINYAHSLDETTATPKSERQASATTQEENIQVASVIEHLPKAERNLSEIISRPPIPFGDNEKSLNVKNSLVEPTVVLSEMTSEQPTSMGPNQLTQEIHQSETINPSVNIQNTSALGQKNGTLSTQKEQKLDDETLLGDNIEKLVEKDMDEEGTELIDAPTPENSESKEPSIIPIHNYKIFCNRGEEIYTLLQDTIMTTLWEE